jgi:hypothetical protein
MNGEWNSSTDEANRNNTARNLHGLLDSKDEHITVLQNVSNYSPEDITLHLRLPQSSLSVGTTLRKHKWSSFFLSTHLRYKMHFAKEENIIHPVLL